MKYVAQSLIAGLIVSSCAMLPPGMRDKKEEPAPQPLTPIVIQPPMIPPPSTANTHAESQV